MAGKYRAEDVTEELMEGIRHYHCQWPGFEKLSFSRSKGKLVVSSKGTKTRKGQTFVVSVKEIKKGS